MKMTRKFVLDTNIIISAINGQAECIITGDQDLLVLHPFQLVDIITVDEFMLKR